MGPSLSRSIMTVVSQARFHCYHGNKSYTTGIEAVDSSVCCHSNRLFLFANNKATGDPNSVFKEIQLDVLIKSILMQ